MTDNLVVEGTIAILFLFSIKEFFAWMRIKKTNSIIDGNGRLNAETMQAIISASCQVNKELLSEIKLINANHLNSIDKSIRDGNEKVVAAINSGNTEVIRLLGEICGRLDK